jgi:hypothetical protein
LHNSSASNRNNDPGSMASRGSRVRRDIGRKDVVQLFGGLINS